MLIVAAVLIAPAKTWAHSAIFTYNLIDGDNLIMVTHNVQAAEAHLPIKYDLRMYTMDGQPVEYDEVRAQIKHGSKTVTAKTVKPANQEASVEFTYPKMGNYKLDLTFLSHDKRIAHAEAAVQVGMGVDDSFASQVLTLPSLLTFLVGAGVTSLFYNRQKFLRRLSSR